MQNCWHPRLQCFFEVHLNFVRALLDVHLDFVSLLFLVALLFAQIELLFAEFELALVFTIFRAGGEIGEALEGEELGGGVFSGGGLSVGFVHDRVVNLFGDIDFFAGLDGVELGKGESVDRRQCGC